MDVIFGSVTAEEYQNGIDRRQQSKSFTTSTLLIKAIQSLEVTVVASERSSTPEKVDSV